MRWLVVQKGYSATIAFCFTSVWWTMPKSEVCVWLSEDKKISRSLQQKQQQSEKDDNDDENYHYNFDSDGDNCDGDGDGDGGSMMLMET